jgi:D-3-phosphoglycerate dehydrogenase
MSTLDEILLTGDIPAEVTTLIEERGFKVRAMRDDRLSDADLAGALAGVRGYLIGGYEEPTAKHFEGAPQLEAVAFLGTDYRLYIPGWQRAFEMGIAVVSTPGANAISVAELTIRLMLTLARPLTAPALGQELHGKTLGLIGAGRIGAHVARMATTGLGMRVVYAAPRRNEPLEAALGVRYVDLPELLERSDVVSLHRPGPAAGEEPLLGDAELGRMKPGSLLVNTVHWSLVDMPALARVIEQGRVRAAFDGIAEGPVWDRLAALGSERFLGVPQIGFQTREASIRSGSWAAEAVCTVLNGGDSSSVNNPDFRRKREEWLHTLNPSR